MAWQKINRAFSGITPLGKFTITPGTPQTSSPTPSLPRFATRCSAVRLALACCPRWRGKFT